MYTRKPSRRISAPSSRTKAPPAREIEQGRSPTGRNIVSFSWSSSHLVPVSQTATAATASIARTMSHPAPNGDERAPLLPRTRTRSKIHLDLPTGLARKVRIVVPSHGDDAHAHTHAHADPESDARVLENGTQARIHPVQHPLREKVRKVVASKRWHWSVIWLVSTSLLPSPSSPSSHSLSSFFLLFSFHSFILSFYLCSTQLTLSNKTKFNLSIPNRQLSTLPTCRSDHPRRPLRPDPTPLVRFAPLSLRRLQPQRRYDSPRTATVQRAPTCLARYYDRARIGVAA